MVSYKNCFYALSIMFTLLSGHSIKSSELGELQARKYINHLLDTLFIPHNHPVSHQQHLHTFSQELTNDLTRNLGTFPHFYSYAKTYNDNQIYQEVINESLLFIEKCARNCAINEIQNYYTETTGNQKTFVDKIVSLLMKELKGKLNKQSPLPQGIFTGYFGTALSTKIQVLIDKELKKESARLEKVNAKTKCPNCSASFDSASHKKITLDCRHTICLVCIKELWHKMGSSIACSTCNSKIKISDYVQGAWVTPTSDYTYDYEYTDYTTPSAPEYDYDYDYTYSY